MVQYLDGRIFPQIGFFDDDLRCISLLDDENIICRYDPFLVNSMILPLEEVKGKVVCMGLGIGYYAYMAHLKEEVTSVCIFEKNKAVVDMFKNNMLPKFDYPEKIKIICDDPLKVLKSDKARLHGNFIFVNYWNDINNGIKYYPKFKALEKHHPHAKYHYYLEQSINACKGIKNENH